MLLSEVYVFLDSLRDPGVTVHFYMRCPRRVMMPPCRVKPTGTGHVLIAYRKQSMASAEATGVQKTHMLGRPCAPNGIISLW